MKTQTKRNNPQQFLGLGRSGKEMANFQEIGGNIQAFEVLNFILYALECRHHHRNLPKQRSGVTRVTVSFLNLAMNVGKERIQCTELAKHAGIGCG
ncbi:hypothetical protein [Paenibacillus jilunlii]|uniref:Uncharacterized protein n=1 Tax=Paenibacillus jilunlii TaxID=682956 RepID=A0ABR5SYL1_9BACL|nr:hypothetical protein [Paenibacillus jilunlii]KWX77605.1 hypothetical protein AML91_07430 [Paenibacillus jilunlii]